MTARTSSSAFNCSVVFRPCSARSWPQNCRNGTRTRHSSRRCSSKVKRRMLCATVPRASCSYSAPEGSRRPSVCTSCCKEALSSFMSAKTKPSLTRPSVHWVAICASRSPPTGVPIGRRAQRDSLFSPPAEYHDRQAEQDGNTDQAPDYTSGHACILHGVYMGRAYFWVSESMIPWVTC